MFLTAWLLLTFLLTRPSAATAEPVYSADVVVYGATPGGIAAAIAAARENCRVILIEPTGRIGGLVTSGLSHTDFHSFESLTGAFLEFSRRVEARYAKAYGPDSPQVRDSFRGTFAEPKVNLAMFEAMLAEHTSITVLKDLRLLGPNMDGKNRLESLTLRGRNGSSTNVSGKVFIDATYEGDLMAAAGVPCRVGREGKGEFGGVTGPRGTGRPASGLQLPLHYDEGAGQPDHAVRSARLSP